MPGMRADAIKTVAAIQTAIDSVDEPVTRNKVANKAGITYSTVARAIRTYPNYFYSEDGRIGNKEYIDEVIERQELGIQETSQESQALERIAGAQETISETLGILIDLMMESGPNSGGSEVGTLGKQAPPVDKSVKPQRETAWDKKLKEWEKAHKGNAKDKDIEIRDYWNQLREWTLGTLKEEKIATDAALYGVYRVIEYELKQRAKNAKSNKAVTEPLPDRYEDRLL